HDITFKGCYIHDVNQIYFDNIGGSDGDAIQVLGTTQLTVQNCLIDRSTTGRKFGLILTEASDNAIIEDNIFIGPMKTQDGGANLFLTGNNQVVRRNIFRDAASGIYSHAESPLIHNNQFIGLNEGIYIASNEGLIYNNTFYNNEISIYSWLRHSIIKNNIAWLTNDNQEAFHVADVTFSNNLQNIEGKSARDEAIIADPLFQDAAHWDFRLQTGSPCINAGSDVGIVLDFDNNPIPCNSVPDIGAFENQSGCQSSGNNRPVAIAGDDIETQAGQEIQLNGSASHDADKDSLFFRWMSAEEINLQKATAIRPFFTAPHVEQTSSYTITLQVNDGITKSEPDALIAIITPTGTSVKPLHPEDSPFSSYPNPAIEKIHIRNNQLPVQAPIRIQIFSLRSVKKQEQTTEGPWNSGKTIEIPLHQLPTGIYLIVIRTPEKIIWQERFIKVRK
ncbi:MAG: NosD domain-containing protein, partial [Bacteroidota bacterium]